MAGQQQVNVARVYKTVVEDVISNVREAFLDEGIDEQVLQELRQLWETKLTMTKAIDNIPNEREQLLAQYNQHQTALQQAQVTVKPQPVQQQPLQQVVTAAVQQSVAGQPLVAPAGIPVLAAAGQPATIDLTNQATLALYQQQIAALQSAGTITLQTGQGGPQFVIQAPQQLIQQGGTTYTVAAPQATTLAQVVTSDAQQQAQPGQPTVHGVIQLDGTNDSSSDDDEYDDNDDNDDDNDDEENEGENDYQGEEEDPLNSGDDVSEEDPSEVFDTENVVVCQYDKINRAKNRWKFHLKDGIMNLKGKDFVFQKASGEAEW